MSETIKQKGLPKSSAMRAFPLSPASTISSPTPPLLHTRALHRHSFSPSPPPQRPSHLPFPLLISTPRSLNSDSASNSSQASQDLGPLSSDVVELEIEKTGKHSRRISSRIAVGACLDTIWAVLTDYEKLADFIPGLAVSQLLEKRENFAKLLQVGQQNLALGLKFNAKGIVECYERELENLPRGRKRDIEFKMVEGDFQNFEGKWSIMQVDADNCKDSENSEVEKIESILSYVVDVEPKRWLPLFLVEGRLCREVELNLLCVRKEAQRAFHDASTVVSVDNVS